MNLESIKTMLKSWQPFVFSVIAVFFGFVTTHPGYFPVWLVDVSIYVAGLGILGVGATAKQHNVSGGTVVIPSNEEAKQAVLNPTAPEKGDLK